MKAFAGSLLLTLPLQLLAHSTNLEIADSIMRMQYGTKFSSKHGCWIYKSVKWGLYCMAPIKLHRVNTNDGERLYVLAEGWPVNPDGEIGGLGAHAAPGVVGAFAVCLNGARKWTLLAATKELKFGSFGSAGTGEAKFFKIGPEDYYGWTFVSGGTWMGTTVTWHHIVAPRDDRFVDLSAIPETKEDDQDHTYDIAFDTTRLDLPVFPLIVTKRFVGAGNRHGPAIETFRVPFDTETWRYQMR